MLNVKTPISYRNSIFKMKIENSIFNFWKQKHYSLNLVFNKKFEIQITLNSKNKFPSQNTYS